MKSTLLTIAICLSQTCVAEEQKVETTMTDSHGTKITTKESQEVKVGVTGTQQVELDQTVTVDPKGILNRRSATVEHESQIKRNGDYKETLETNDLEGTTEKDEITQETDTPLLGKGRTTTTVRKKEVDPKGLFNKETLKVKEEVTEDGSGNVKRKVTTTINGKEVSEEKSND